MDERMKKIVTLGEIMLRLSTLHVQPSGEEGVQMILAFHAFVNDPQSFFYEGIQ